MSEQVSLKEVVLSRENVLTICLFYIQKCQQKGVYKIGESSTLFRASQVFRGEEKEWTEKQAAQLLINGLIAGQSTGVYTLEESHLIHTKFVPYMTEQFITEPKVVPEEEPKVV